MTKQFAPPPQPEPEIDYEAEIEAEINRVSDSLDKWRTALIELAKEHAAVDGKGRCRRCHDEARGRTALTRLTIEHMLEDAKGRCTQCSVKAPCDTKKAVTRINRGIAHQIEKYASMDDRELEVALGNRRWVDYDEDEDWGGGVTRAASRRLASTAAGAG